jgi:hypothetical protein
LVRALHFTGASFIKDYMLTIGCFKGKGVDKKILILGGVTSNNNTTNSLINTLSLFDPEKETISTLTPLGMDPGSISGKIQINHGLHRFCHSSGTYSVNFRPHGYI